MYCPNPPEDTIMAKKDKPKNVEKMVKKVNKKFAKTTSHIESLFNDALKQFDNLQSQIKEPVHKLRKDIDQLRDREMKRFNEEFERRLQEFQEMQNSLLERLGLGHADEDKPDNKKPALPTPAAPKKKKKAKSGSDVAPESAPPKSKAPKSKAPKKTKAKATPEPASTPAPTSAEAPAKAPAKAPVPAPAKTKAKTTQLADPSDLTRVKGIGPATQKKMKEAGLTTIGQIAYPSADDQEKLKAFASIKGFDQLAAEAKKIV
jgi:predicted flap endonuclease-1-like 5' DNA nuclease/DNA-binding protein H-NS